MEKICVLRTTPDGTERPCLKAGCGMWRGLAHTQEHGEGYCGLAGKPLELSARREEGYVLDGRD